MRPSFYHLLISLCCFYLLPGKCFSQSIVSDQQLPNSFSLAGAVIYVDPDDDPAVLLAASSLYEDINAVTGKKPELTGYPVVDSRKLIIIGSLEKSSLIKQLLRQKKISAAGIKDKWEAYQVSTVSKPTPDIDEALVIMGSDRRGTAYGVYELSKQLGVSPWYWWADVPVKKKADVFIKKGVVITDAPKVKYRGIFINDEAPALSGWAKEKFGGFNHLFYEKVFELMLRLKANYVWPAMWGNAFYYDDSLNKLRADQYGIVIGTSHHEPLMRAHEEWKYFGKGKWNYDSNEVRLKEFWKGGMQRATNEKIVTIGMRGDGDEPMSRETATALLERIVKDQRQIIEDVTGKPAEQTPQLWALYKEVQDYYDKGMRVPDDVTLLLCDDNWGNIRKLPKLNEKPRKGGYGIYYHFDYVGGPRNYKWINTNPIPRVWEQMHLAWEYNARQIWIVNVVDIKPMEFPISFFLDYAWNPEKIQAEDLQKYTEQWSADQFGNKYAKEIADMISRYGKYNSRRKPELLDQRTYSLDNYNEFSKVVFSEYNPLAVRAEELYKELPTEYKDAFYQLVLYPVAASANLNEMYYSVAMNQQLAARNMSTANVYATRVKELYARDSMLSLTYNRDIANGKWSHMMDQAHIGYTNWQQPPQQTMPVVKYLPENMPVEKENNSYPDVARSIVPGNASVNSFYEEEGVVSIESSHYTTAINTNGISWKVLPDLGRTGSAITPFPVTAASQEPGNNAPHLEYEFYTYSQDSLKLQAFFSPTLNFENTETGLRYAVSIDNETPQIISINGEDKATGSGIWNKWVAENIIIKTTGHKILQAGKHTLKYWMVDPAVVLQKLVLNFGAIKPSYLGPPETLYQSKK